MTHRVVASFFIGLTLACAAVPGRIPSYPLLQVQQSTQHIESKADPKTFDRYIGSYQLAPSAVMTISRDGDQLYAQLTGQPAIEIFHESDGNFFLKEVDAQITFDAAGPQGAATQATLHQNGRDMVAKRISDTEAKRAADDLAKKVKDQTQSPGTEAALRGMIQGIQSGQPKYEIMSRPTADATRQQLPQLKGAMDEFGALKTVKFTGVGPAGADIYQVDFENASTEWRLMLDQDGKVTTITFRPLQ